MGKEKEEFELIILPQAGALEFAKLSVDKIFKLARIGNFSPFVATCFVYSFEEYQEYKDAVITEILGLSVLDGDDDEEEDDEDEEDDYESYCSGMGIPVDILITKIEMKNYALRDLEIISKKGFTVEAMASDHAFDGISKEMMRIHQFALRLLSKPDIIIHADIILKQASNPIVIALYDMIGAMFFSEIQKIESFYEYN